MAPTVGEFQGFHKRPRPPGSARRMLDPIPDRIKANLERAANILAQPYVGITTDGKVIPGLYSIAETGVSTRQIKEAADTFMNSLTDDQKRVVLWAYDAPQWRQWTNGESFALRNGKGISFETMSRPQRELAFDIIRASFSAHGFTLVRNCMKLNDTLREICDDNENLGEWLYFMNIFGTPSMTEPWGWQMDGHHINLHCFVLGDQIVMTPLFLGAEPREADRGPYIGTRVFDDEEQTGLEMIRALTPAQQNKAILYRSTRWEDVPRERTHPADGRHLGGALRDNQIAPYEGIRADEFTAGQKSLLISLISVWTSRIHPGHDQVWLEEVRRHIDDTYLCWMGGVDDESPFYYNIHSPVAMFEFDHHHGVFLDNYQPKRFHIHTAVRTPNGNDYGKDLLRQHLERHHQPPK